VESIQKFIAGKTLATFEGDDLLRSGVLVKLMIIGEATANISEATRDKYPAVPWAQIRGFRNFVIHAYFRTNWSIVWNAASINAPELAKQVGEIIRNEYPHIDPERL
jgi:uncharacterized protein with HEPN domain